jgi:hypothetical protein
VSGALHPGAVQKAERFVAAAQLKLASTLPREVQGRLRVVVHTHTDVEVRGRCAVLCRVFGRALQCAGVIMHLLFVTRPARTVTRVAPPCHTPTQALLLNQPRVQEQPDGSVVVAVHALLALPNVVRPGAGVWRCVRLAHTLRMISCVVPPLTCSRCIQSMTFHAMLTNTMRVSMHMHMHMHMHTQGPSCRAASLLRQNTG